MLRLRNCVIIIEKIILYVVPYKARKITINVYIEHILPSILDALLDPSLTLYQDKDSAYNAKATLNQAKKHTLTLIYRPCYLPQFLDYQVRSFCIKEEVLFKALYNTEGYFSTVYKDIC